MKRITGEQQVQAIGPEECAGHMGETVCLQGHVHKIRRMSGFAFVVLRTRRALVQAVYSPERAGFSLDALAEEMPVRVWGEVVHEPRSRTGWELHLTGCEVLGHPVGEPAAVINGKRMDLSLDTLLDLRPLTLRNPHQRAIFTIQAALAAGFRSFLEKQAFTEIHSPKLVASGAEGGANVFAVPYFGQEAYLAQSPQLYKQMMVGVYERVFEIAPVFRAEKHDTARHLNEYTSVDLEMGFIDGFEDVMQMEVRMLRYALAALKESCGPELELLGVKVPLIGEVPVMSFAEAKALVSEAYGRKVSDENDMDPEEERLLCAYCEKELGSEFVFVTHYPSAKRPFYAMETPENPAVTESFDLLFRGLEVTTGGQRIHGYAQQVEKMERLGMELAVFESFLMAHRSGLPPHGGLGLGLERFTARLLELPNVRQATLFPRDCHRLEP